MDEREREVRRRMAEHELYRDVGAGLEALEEERVRGKELAYDFNVTRPRETGKREQLLKELFGAVGEHVWIEPRCTWRMAGIRTSDTVSTPTSGSRSWTTARS
jgi:galactoside O-acetyltransferase